MSIGSNMTASGLLDRYGITVYPGSPQMLVARTNGSLLKLPNQLVKDCGIQRLGFRDLGPSRELYPNHGVYVNDQLFLNSQLVDDPLIFKDSEKTLDRFDHTLFHELGHGWDMVKGELSKKSEWLELSGWTEEPTSDTVRIIIRDPDAGKDVEGEWCYNPSAEFVRFYARRNPWDDFADTFAFYVGGLKGFLPKEKAEYFDKKLKDYYG